MGETRVDLQHLLEDLRDAYTGALEETILTEIVANALDSGATSIRLQPSPADARLTVVDDGRGMQRRELARYHDVAASTKSRGEGIGFAGVGIKLGLLVSSEVVTETRRGATHVATRWHLASRYRAPWKWIPPPGLTGPRGTAVRLCLTNPLSPLLDAGYLEEAVRRHFEPLLDPAFDDLLGRHYTRGIAFEVDGQVLPRQSASREDRVIVGGEAGDVEGAKTPDDELPPGAVPRSPSTPTGEHEPAAEPLPDDTIAGARSPTALPTPVGTFATVPGRRRPARYGLLLQFESRPDDSELGRLVDSTIWINEAHPAYARAAASRSAGYHIALTVALALAPLAVGARDEHAFITQFLAHWGGSESKKTRRRRHRG